MDLDGTVTGCWIAPGEGEPMDARDRVEAVAVGDAFESVGTVRADPDALAAAIRERHERRK